MLPTSNIKGLYHFSYPCRDAEETRKFYEELLGLPLVNFMRADKVPSTGESNPYAHMFFEMGDGSYVAFFDLGTDTKPLPLPATPDWVMHFAMEVPTLADVMALKARLEAAGVEVKGIVDHEFIQSIYFFDPNGLRLEVTVRTEQPGVIEQAARTAHDQLNVWSRYKATRAPAASPASARG